MSERATIRVRGQVRGVFFRVSTQKKARTLGLTGLARNEHDGSVSIVAEGEHAKIEQLIDWAHRGPDMASVRDVVVEWGDATGVFNDFTIQ